MDAMGWRIIDTDTVCPHPGQAQIPREELKSSLGVLAMVPGVVEVEERVGREVEVERGLLGGERPHQPQRRPSCMPQRRPPSSWGRRARPSRRSEEEPVEVE